MTPEKKTMVKMTPDLVNFISFCSSEVSCALYASEFIPEDLHRKLSSCNDPTAAVRDMVGCVSNKVSHARPLFVEFVRILRGISGSGDVVDKLERLYSKFGGKPLTGEAEEREEEEGMEDRKVPCGGVETITRRRPPVVMIPHERSPVVQRENEIERRKENHSSILYSYKVLILVVVILGSLGTASIIYWRISGDAECHEIKRLKDLATYLGEIKDDPEKICSYLQLKNCNDLKYSKKLSSYHMADYYIRQKHKACWETIISLLCKDFNEASLAKKMADEFSIDYDAYC